MKTIVPLIIYLVVAHINTFAQNMNEVIAINNISADKTGYETFLSNEQGDNFTKKRISKEKIYTPIFIPDNQPFKNTAPKFDDPVVSTQAPITGRSGDLHRPAVPDYYTPLKNFLHRKKQYRICSLLALNGVIMIARNIPYLINSLENRAFLKLCCQKTVLGTSGRACKKVTGLTFCVPLGK